MTAMEVRTDTCTVLLSDSEIQYYGPDGSHWASVRLNTAVDLVAATDEILQARGLPSIGAARDAWRQRAEARLNAAVVAVAFAAVGWTIVFGTAIAAALWL